MKKPAALLLGITLAACMTAPLHAQIYQWKDANGRTIISDSPPPSSVKGSRISGGSNAGEQPATPDSKPDGKPENKAPTPADTSKSLAEKEVEFRKRQQEAKAKEEKRNKEEAEKRDRERFCDMARRQVSSIEGGIPLSVANEEGKQQFMTDEQRSEEVGRLNRQISEHCN